MSLNSKAQGVTKKKIETFLTFDGTLTTSELPRATINTTINLVGEFTPEVPGVVYVQPPENGDEVWSINRFLFFIEDNSIAPDKYGAINQLTNGVLLEHTDKDDNVITLFTPLAVTTNSEWVRHNYDGGATELGNSSNYGVDRWSWFEDSMELQLFPGEKLRVVARDDLSSLFQHTFWVEGWVNQINPNI